MKLPDVETVRPKRGPFGLLFLIVLADMMGFGILIPLLPFYALKFDASSLQVTLLLSVYSASQFIAAPMLGSLSDRIGRRPVLVFSQLGSAAASVTLGIATAIHFGNPSLGLAIIYASRIIDGISGGNVSAAQAYVADVTPREQKSRYLGLLGAAFGIGFAIGPAIGGVLGHFHAALPPFAAAAFSLTAATLAYFRLPESLKEPVRHEPGWHIVRSARLMREPVLAQLTVVWFLSMFAYVTMESIFALFLAHRFGFGELGVGLTFTFAGAMIIVVQGRLIGPLVKRMGEWNIAVIGPALFTCSMILYAAVMQAQASWAILIAMLGAGVMFGSLGRSLQTPTMSTLVSHASPHGRQGAAFGLFHGMGSLARVFGPALAGGLYGDRPSPRPFWVAAVLSALAFAWTLSIRIQHRTHETANQPTQPSAETP